MLRLLPIARFLSLFFSLFFVSGIAKATHIVGGDLAYTHVSGSTYKVTLTLYGDCGPLSAGAFASLPSATPQICVYDGGTSVTTLTLSVEAPSTGIEITPLCPGATSQCVSPSSPIPAVKRFVYSANYTLPHASTVWRFIFNGSYGISAAGRAAAITNIAGAGSTTMQLIDTLNNAGYTNSSPALAVTQSTFFCLNDYNYYNPTATDPDGDVLSYSLIPATNGPGSCTTVGGTVAYATADAWPGTPLSGATPIRVATGTYGFNTATGQLTFYPNVLQRAVIVYNIREIRGGVLVGSSQREMTVLVTGACATSSPCTGSPIAGTASVGIGCGSGTDTLITSGSSCAGVSFQWQSSADNITWTNIIGATNTTHPFTPSASLYYRCRVLCIASGMASYTGAIFYALSTAASLATVVSFPADTSCTGVNFKFTGCSTPGYEVHSYFGDGTSGIYSLTPTTASVSHTYALPGTYTIKHILVTGTSRVDSVTYAITYNYCRTLPLKFYNDNNANCTFDAGDTWNFLPLTVNVDSAGTTVGTYTVTSGLFYKAYGGPGTIYTFHVTGVPAGHTLACPVSATISDTILAAAYAYPTNFFGLQCSAATGFDLQELVSFRARPTWGKASITITNPYCTPVTDVVTMNFSPKYAYFSAFPAPTSVTGTTVSWSPGSISGTSGVQNINVTLVPSGSPLIAADTVNTHYVTTPITGDLVPANNTVHRIDTVFASFDPNAISVSPQGYISAGTELTYTIDFENVGNAPAANIHILDTLSGYLIPSTLSVVGASHAMNLVVLNTGANTIAKFDFPNIDLPDSSHHHECHGMVMFKIRTQTGLAPGTIIPARAGIYFDDNDVVATNTVHNIILTPTSVPAVDRDNTIIYPNPANDQINIRNTAGAYSHITITNTLGRTLIQQPLTTHSINISDLQPGIYYVTLHGKLGTTTGKFVKL